MEDEDIGVLAALLTKYSLFDDIQKHMVREPHEGYHAGSRDVSNYIQIEREVLKR